jgi:hypothetical protein
VEVRAIKAPPLVIIGQSTNSLTHSASMRSTTAEQALILNTVDLQTFTLGLVLYPLSPQFTTQPMIISVFYNQCRARYFQAGIS